MLIALFEGAQVVAHDCISMYVVYMSYNAGVGIHLMILLVD